MIQMSIDTAMANTEEEGGDATYRDQAVDVPETRPSSSTMHTYQSDASAQLMLRRNRPPNKPLEQA
jgi:hypothetical protein